MRKLYFVSILLMMVLLSACQGKSPTATLSVSSPTIPVTPTQIATETIEPTSTKPAPESQAAKGCTVISPKPDPGPTEQSIFPPVDENDWVNGAEDGAVTVLVYSDFQ